MPDTDIKFTRGVPATEAFPTAQLAECAVAAFRARPELLLQYGSAAGYPPLCAYLASNAGVDPRQIVVGQGSLQLLDFLARILLQPGALVYVEEPTYDRALAVLRRSGARVEGIPLQDDGPDVDLLETRLRAGEHPVLFYTIPDFQNPSGVVISAEKRKQIAHLAETHGFLIVEDIPYRQLRYRGQDIPSFADYCAACVVQMSSFSKLIAPGLRVGYARLPETLAPRLLKFVEDTYISPSYVTQAIVHEFIHRGYLHRNIANLKALYTPRLDAMLAALQDKMSGLAGWHTPDGGFFVGLTLKQAVQADELVARGKQAGLALTNGRGFFASENGDSFVRLPFCALTPAQIQEGISRLASVVQALPVG